MCSSVYPGSCSRIIGLAKIHAEMVYMRRALPTSDRMIRPIPRLAKSLCVPLLSGMVRSRLAVELCRSQQSRGDAQRSPLATRIDSRTVV